MADSRKFLDPETISRLRGFELRSRSVVSGVLSGMHRSAYHGNSVEFAEHRQYVPGDDLRHVDWRLFGRKDRFYIKQYEEETNLHCHVLLDVSRSMAFGAPDGGRARSRSPSAGQRDAAPFSKFEYAAHIAASLAYMLVRQQDAVGLLTFDHAVRGKLNAGTGKAHLADFVALLGDSAPHGATDVKILFHRLAEELARRSMVVLISDLLTETEDVAAGLAHICLSGHELIVFHVMDDREWNFPFVENVLFEGLEDDAELLADPQALRASYLSAVRRFVARVRGACLKHRADYVPVNTRDPLDAVLCGYLGRRAGMGVPPTADPVSGPRGEQP